MHGLLYAVEPNHGELERINPRIRRSAGWSTSRSCPAPSKVWMLTRRGELRMVAGGLTTVVGPWPSPRAACTCRRPAWHPASKPRAPAGSWGEPVGPVDHGRGGLDLPDRAQLQARWRAARLQPRLPVRARSRRGQPYRAALTLAVTPSAGQPPWRRRGSSTSPRRARIDDATAATTGDGVVSSLPSVTRPAPRPEIQLGA
jgi:hypothetical protein